MQEAIQWQMERFTSAEPQLLLCEVEMALDPPLEGKQCSHQFDKLWHMQGVRILRF